MRTLVPLCIALLVLTGGQARLPAQENGGAAPPDGRLLTITEAEELARRNADEVRIRSAAVDAALGAEGAARAAFYPSVSATASGAYLVNPPAGVNVPKGALGTMAIPGLGTIEMPAQDFVVVKDAEPSYFKGNITFTQPIVAWGKIRAAVDLASLELQAAIAGRDGAALDAAREANRAYYAAKLATESLPILEELHALASQIIADRASTLTEGLGTRERLLAARADLADLESRLVSAREGAESALTGLAALTGLPEGGRIDTVSDFRSELPPLDEARISEGAPASSTDWTTASLRLRQAGRKLDLERGSAALRPDLAFFASLDASGQSPPLTRSGWQDSWTWDLSLGLSLSVDLFDGGSSSAKIAEATAQREAATAALRGAATAARLAARKAVQTAREAEAGLRRAEAHAAWRAETLRNAQSSAENQLISRQDLNGAAIQDATARLDLLAAKYSFEEALADLERLAQGELP